MTPSPGKMILVVSQATALVPYKLFHIHHENFRMQVTHHDENFSENVSVGVWQFSTCESPKMGTLQPWPKSFRILYGIHIYPQKSQC